ncbi:MAG: thioredoxin family protein [Synechococcales bacterium]|nr:thioredoxin family protein [Synechococcales bacterium]
MMQVNPDINCYAPDFELPGVDGSVHHLTRYLESHRAIGVVVMCNHCPYVRGYLERLRHIQADYAPQGFTLIGINGNDDRRYPDDSFDQMKVFATENDLNFPYLRDVTQDVVRTFGADRTPEVFLLNREGVICYRGAIDDNPTAASQVKTQYLREAIAQLLSNTPITVAETPAVGCSVKWRDLDGGH